MRYAFIRKQVCYEEVQHESNSAYNEYSIYGANFDNP